MEHEHAGQPPTKRAGSPALCLSAVLAASTAASAAGGPAALEVEITGFETDDGALAIALFDSAEDYARQTDAVRKAYLTIEAGRSVWRLEGLPEGEYALIAYHDRNGNREIDMRVLGMPKEPVAVSNNARGFFGPPKFDAARFGLSAPLTRQLLELR